MNKIVTILATLACMVNIAVISAQQTAQTHIIEVDYLLYLPEGYDEDTGAVWPLVVFLHGGGETGTDIEKVKAHGLPKLVEQGHQFPFIGVSPQSRSRGWDPRTVASLTEAISSKYRVDRDRLYLTGLSMGGHGTWNTVSAYPGLFAAAAPICGGGDPAKAYAFVNTPVWNFHGDSDETVPISRSDRMVEAVREHNSGIKYTVYAGVGHDSWTQTYENPEFWEWLLAQRRHTHKQVQLSADELISYAGLYVSAEEGYRHVEFPLEADGNKLAFVDRNGRGFNLYPAGDDIFFLGPDVFDFMKFERDSDGNIPGALLYGSQGLESIVREN